MSTGFVGILSVELHFPENGSLKGKRKFVKSAAQLRTASACRSPRSITTSLATGPADGRVRRRDHAEVERLLDDAERYLFGQEYELISTEREVVVPGD